MSLQKVPSDWKQCATCARWGGSRRPADFALWYVEFESEDKGKCYQGGFNQADMRPQASCNQWEQQYKKKL